MHPIHEGVRRFQAEVFPGLSERFAGLAEGQSPHSLFITCSDSRIDPGLVTQSRPGEIFVQRNAGNLVPEYGRDEGTASAVEYAVAALGVQLIVVCGHSGCGAMGALLNPGSLALLPRVASWVEHAAPTGAAVADYGPARQLDGAIEHNALRQLDNLQTHPSVQVALAEGRLRLEAWVYDIASGSVRVVGSVGSEL